MPPLGQVTDPGATSTLSVPASWLKSPISWDTSDSREAETTTSFPEGQRSFHPKSSSSSCTSEQAPHLLHTPLGVVPKHKVRTFGRQGTHMLSICYLNPKGNSRAVMPPRDPWRSYLLGTERGDHNFVPHDITHCKTEVTVTSCSTVGQNLYKEWESYLLADCVTETTGSQKRKRSPALAARRCLRAIHLSWIKKWGYRRVNMAGICNKKKSLSEII